jgi:hypothetical protein
MIKQLIVLAMLGILASIGPASAQSDDNMLIQHAFLPKKTAS